MELDLDSISPHVRMVKIVKSSSLSGEWIDYDHVFTYIEQGEAEFILNGVKYLAGEGDVFLMPPFMPHLIRTTSAVPLIQHIVQFDLYDDPERRQWRETTVINGTTGRLPDRERLLSAVSPASRLLPANRLEFLARLARMRQLFAEGEKYGCLKLKACCIELICDYLGSLSADRFREGRKTKGWAMIEKAIHYINKRYGDPRLNNREIGEHVGVSANYLSFVFKDQLRITLHKYVTHVRIEQAKLRMVEGGKSLTEIADETGFTSIHVFSRAFKSELGLSPSQFSNGL
ncbi:helix-turn-helix domain-containing protein [Cohnella zeiphila]|uniref:helix-turn-helix domain-containing protein n=1 Tax=Cohnella zeiphila TaxID=2761120 RepID=UPI00192E05DD